MSLKYMNDDFINTEVLDPIQSFQDISLDATTITISTPKMVQEITADPTILMKYPNLIEFNCENKDLQNLPQLPPTLEKLYCGSNNLQTLPQLPPALIVLNCTENSLTELPILPKSLRVLEFSDNLNITSLPMELPPGLENIMGFNNKITHLPPLPDTLKILAMGNCELAEIPPLPEGLVELNVTHNNLTYIPRLPDSLELIYIGLNKIHDIPNIPNKAINIHCNGNKLITFPPLKFSPNLKILYCIENQLTEIPELPNNLKYLYCSYNKLTRLPPLPATIVLLHCNNNQILEIPSPIPPALKELLCNNNKITQLPPLPTTLHIFNCTRNPLHMAPQLTTGEYLNLRFENNRDRISNTPQIAIAFYDVPTPNVYAAPANANLRLVVFDDCFACDRQQKWLNADEMKSRHGMGCSINSMRFMNLFDEAEQQRMLDATNGYVTPFSTVIEYTKKHTNPTRQIFEKQFDVTTLGAVRSLFVNLQKWMPNNSCTIFRYSNSLDLDDRGNTFGHTVVLNKDEQGILYVVDPVQNKIVRHNSDKLFNNMHDRGDDSISLMFEIIVPGRSGGGGGRTRRRRRRRQRHNTKRKMTCRRRRKRT